MEEDKDDIHVQLEGIEGTDEHRFKTGQRSTIPNTSWYKENERNKNYEEQIDNQQRYKTKCAALIASVTGIQMKFMHQ